MPLLDPLALTMFSDKGPVPRPLRVGEGLATMLLCLQHDQELRAPEGDGAETVFVILSGDGAVEEGGETHTVTAGNAVHISPGTTKALKATGGQMVVLGVRRLKGKG